jgi:hypothetical protein
LVAGWKGKKNNNNQKMSKGEALLHPRGATIGDKTRDMGLTTGYNNNNTLSIHTLHRNRAMVIT